MKANEFKTPPVAVDGQGRAGWFAGFMRRPASFRAAAVAGSIALVGVLGVGAAAATGNAPEPVREFFGSSSSALRVEFDGVINAIDANARTLDVDVAGDVRTVHVIDSTELSRGGDTIAFDLFAVGDPVEVKGALQPDDTIVASRVHLEDEFEDEPDADQTIDEDDDADDDDDADHEDNSGPGDAEDEDDDADEADDSSGPGSDDDDGDDHEDGNDDDLDDDNSGSGSLDDDAGDDDSGPGSIDDSDDSTDTDDEAEDDSGSDSESDDSSDDSSGSGSDDEPDDD